MPELFLPTERTRRDALVQHAEILDQVGDSTLIPSDGKYATLAEVAEYLNLPRKSLANSVNYHRKELGDDYQVFNRATASEHFQSDISGATSTTIAGISRAGILRLAMLIGRSTVGAEIRTILDPEASSAPTLHHRSVLGTNGQPVKRKPAPEAKATPKRKSKPKAKAVAPKALPAPVDEPIVNTVEEVVEEQARTEYTLRGFRVTVDLTSTETYRKVIEQISAAQAALDSGAWAQNQYTEAVDEIIAKAIEEVRQ